MKQFYKFNKLTIKLYAGCFIVAHMFSFNKASVMTDLVILSYFSNWQYFNSNNLHFKEICWCYLYIYDYSLYQTVNSGTEINVKLQNFKTSKLVFSNKNEVPTKTNWETMTQDISFYTRIITSRLLSGSLKDLEERARWKQFMASKQ